MSTPTKSNRPLKAVVVTGGFHTRLRPVTLSQRHTCFITKKPQILSLLHTALKVKTLSRVDASQPDLRRHPVYPSCSPVTRPTRLSQSPSHVHALASTLTLARKHTLTTAHKL